MCRIKSPQGWVFLEFLRACQGICLPFGNVFPVWVARLIRELKILFRFQFAYFYFEFGTAINQ